MYFPKTILELYIFCFWIDCNYIHFYTYSFEVNHCHSCCIRITTLISSVAWKILFSLNGSCHFLL
ncbi:unnamed protein product [Phytomonas sp. EM1]|nr:unnamed protein product [Phytomonas sp. EM1]|eukprot:CCW65251.1 unnamed protein product [Phytomonas sp. isolate EM1]